MTTTHEYDAYCDAIGHEPEPDYYEQCCVMEEFEEAHEAALKTEGAKEALQELKLYLLHCAVHPELKKEMWGLSWAVDAISRRLSDLEPMEGGAA